MSIAPIQGLAGLLEPISSAGIDTYARQRFEGKGMDEALQACMDTYVVGLSLDPDKPEQLEPLASEAQTLKLEA